MHLIERRIRDGGRDPRELADVSTSIKPRGEEVRRLGKTTTKDNVR